MIQTKSLHPKNTDKPKKTIQDANDHRYTIFIDDDYLYISFDKIPQKMMVIERKNGETQIENINDQKYLQITSIKKKSRFYLIVGKITFKDIDFLVVISKAGKIGEILGKKIYQVLSVQFLAINKQDYDTKAYEKCYTPIYKLKNFLKQGFYFSYTYNLHQKIDGELNQNQDLNSNSYVWNYRSLKNLYNSIKDEFFTPLIQGYFGQISTLDNTYLILISRRSFMMGGTRYNSRGIDNNGYVANYVETEILMIKNKEIKSHNQIRGSLPFHWGQKGVQAKIQINQTLQQNVNALQKHLKMVTEEFQQENLIFFNLLGINRGDENILTEYLIELLGEVRREGNENIKYVHVDFHGITKETDFSAVDEYVYDLIQNSGYNQFQFQDKEWIQVKKQREVIRTNCMDCLDRTNAAQTKISFAILFQFLKDWDYNLFNDNFLECKPLIYLQKGQNSILDNFRKLWADNGDNISKIYAGTGATTSSVTRKGQKSGLTSIFDHGIKTISRFYLNNFEDNFKQEIIDSLLNKKQTSIRQSILDLDVKEIKIFKIGVVSLLGNKQHEMLEISLDLMISLFQTFVECDYILFIFYNHNQTNIKVKAKEYHVYKNYKEIFETFSPILGDFQISSYSNEKFFEVFLMSKNSTKQYFQYYNCEKAKLARFQPSLGLKLSFILNKTSLIAFPLILDKGKKKNEESIKKILDKFLDKFYDLIFIIGNIDEDIELREIHKNYDHVYEVTVVSKNSSLNNQISILCSKKLIEEDQKPMQVETELGELEIQQDFTINLKQFAIFGHDNQLLLSMFLNSSIT